MSKFSLNQDILYLILDKLGTHPCKNHTNAALVARDWTIPAQASLYKCKIRIFVGDTDYYPSIRKRTRLARTMDTAPHLRTLLRSLSIVVDGPPPTEGDDPCLNWLQLVPPHTLHRFEFRCDGSGYSCLRLMRAPAVQTVRSLSMHGLMSMEELKASLVPGVQELFLETGADFPGEIDCALPPNLRQLTISSPFRWRAVLYKLFILLSPQLDSFSTDGPWYASGDFHPWMESAIARHGRGLKRLHLMGESRAAQSCITRPFLDELVVHSTRLEYLRVFAGTYTDRLFRRLPASVRVLEFVGDQKPIPFEDALLECVARVGEKSIALNRIVVFSCEFLGVGRPEVYTRLAEACAANGVEFEYVGYDRHGPSGQTWPRRIAIFNI